MFVCIFCCLFDIFDAGFQQQSKGKGSVGSHTTRSVSLCQVLLEIRRVHNMYSFRIVFVRYSSSETQGQSVRPGEKARQKFSSRAEKPLGTDSHRTISEWSSEC